MPGSIAVRRCVLQSQSARADDANIRKSETSLGHCPRRQLNFWKGRRWLGLVFQRCFGKMKIELVRRKVLNILLISP